MSKAAELAALIGSQTALSNRNLIINGAMQVAQRGTSAVTSSGGFPVDRFSASYNVTSGAFSSVQSSVTPDNFVSSLKWETTTAASAGTDEVCTFGTKIEGYDITQFNWGTSAAKKCVVSFQVRSSLTGTYSFAIRNSDASRSYIAEYTISSADTWEQKEITIPGPTDGTWNSTNGIGMILNWDLGSGSGRQGTAGSWLSGTNDFASTNQVNFANTANAAFYITGIQLEVGEQATPFEHRSFADELARCQRYFAKTADDDNSRCVGHGSHRDSTQFRVIASVPVTMRIDQPSLVEKSPGSQTYRFNGSDGNYNNDGSTAATLDNGGQPKFTVNVGGFSGLSAGDNGLVKVEGSGNWLALDAEL